MGYIKILMSPLGSDSGCCVFWSSEVWLLFVFGHIIISSSVGRASDQHAADAGVIPQCGKGFFFQSTFSAGSPMVTVQPLCAIACFNICPHIKDP